MYQHLTRKKLHQICIPMKAKHTPEQIARLLGRHRSTISREIEGGHGQRGYRAEQACNKTKRAHKAAPMPSTCRRGCGLRWSSTNAFIGAPHKLTASSTSFMKRFTNMLIWTRPMGASCTKPCVAKSPGVKTTPLVSVQHTLRLASK